uniref:XPA C-terminal domain-containing protein n=1 Tax=Acrobeloides nanus TaxID=290746 RepID=A0A914DQA6_9BILA
MPPRKRKSEDNVPVVEKLYRRNQVSYEGAGGFSIDDDEYSERREELREKRDQKRDRQYVYITAPDNCIDCEKPLLDSFLWDKFNYAVCNNCRDENGRHKLIAKTDARKQYLLKDCDFDLRQPALRFISKKNPHNPRYGDMKLYLKLQVEARALEIFESWERLEEERSNRTASREAASDKKFEKKIREMRKEIRGFSHIKINVNTPHEHEFGEESYNEKTDEYSKECNLCGYLLTYEKL